MRRIEEFESRLMNLAPNEDDFVLKVDELVEDFAGDFEPLIPAIFRFFEKNALEDCGAPGTLVHLTEDYYPKYVPELLESLKRRPSYNTILMINRILNSELTAEQRTEFMDILTQISEKATLEPELRKEASDFIAYQNS